MRFINTASVLSLLLLTGCSTMMAPTYNGNPENAKAPKSLLTYPIKVGNFTAANEKLNKLTIRGRTFASPYRGSYATYLQEALRQELYDAGYLNSNSDIEISGILIRNEIDASGINIGTANIDANFFLKKGNTILFETSKSATHQWKSNFGGEVAVPKAQANYEICVQKLIQNLIFDKEFQRALQIPTRASVRTRPKSVNF